MDQICMEFNFRIEKLVGKKYWDSGLHARQDIMYCMYNRRGDNP